MSPHRIHPATRPAYVHLNVAGLDSQVVFYQTVLRLELNWRTATGAGLGVAGRDLVRLTHLPGGKRYWGVTGIYHFAILFPNRRELARAMARLFSVKWPNAPTDHVMTKTTYLADPEGNEIELYCESPEDGVFLFDKDGGFRAEWADGRPSNGREPLDLQALFSHLEPDDRLDTPVPPETRLGHFHLYVSSLAETRRFYHELLGFDDMGVGRAFRMGMVSAGGYHHHIGYNTWQGEGAPPPPPDALGLKHIAFTLPTPEAWQAFWGRVQELGLPYHETEEGLLLTDPAQNGVCFAAPPAPSTR
ncbi:MAG: glyoxalase [Anaerolineae bacterium]|nr:MAG: glyoxalase [Anaerolineae bacterium]